MRYAATAGTEARVSTSDMMALDLHHMLLRLAGWAPDDLLAEARDSLAEDGLAEVVRVLASAGERTALPLTDDDLVILAHVAEAGSADSRLVDTIEQVGPDTAVPWRFDEAPPGGDLNGAKATDDTLVAAMADEPAVRGLWRAWRMPVSGAPQSPARPVYVVEADDVTGHVALTGRLQRLLKSAGESAPRVEVVPVRGNVPAYQRMAWRRGRLLCAAADTRKISVARLFDAVDPTTGPTFAPDHPRITDKDERDRTLAYLQGGTALLVTLGMLDDIVRPHRGAVVPINYRTDGTWIWTDTATYYLEKYQLAPDPELLRHIRAADGPPGALDTVSLHRAFTALATAATAPVWSAPGASAIVETLAADR